MKLLNLKKSIEENPLALATVDQECRPHVIAVACLRVVSDSEIVITDNYMQKTKENILSNENVALTFWDKDWKGYKLAGKAQYIDHGELLEFVKAMEENKSHPAKGAVLVTVETIE